MAKIHRNIPKHGPESGALQFRYSLQLYFHCKFSKLNHYFHFALPTQHFRLVEWKQLSTEHLCVNIFCFCNSIMLKETCYHRYCIKYFSDKFKRCRANVERCTHNSYIDNTSRILLQFSMCDLGQPQYTLILQERMRVV